MRSAAPVPFAALLVMAGSGTRFGGSVPKVQVELGGEPLWRVGARTLAGVPGCVGLVLVVAAGAEEAVRSAAAPLPGVRVVRGGPRRQDSVRLGLAALPAEARVVAVHDAARPLVAAGHAAAVVEAADRHGAALLAVPARDTVKRVDAAGRVTATLDRSELWLAQTPQCFRVELLRAAHAAAERDGVDVTDDAALVERGGGEVRVVRGDPWNLKVTEPDDLVVVRALAAQRGAADAP